jgi:hypothetical protein
MPYKYKELISAVKKKTPVSKEGWRDGREESANIEIDGQCVSRVTLPHQHGKVDFRLGTQDSIRKQLLLDKNQFGDYIRCSLTRTDYIGIVREKYFESH